jgi:uncharacterized protein (TIGR03435 family)
MQLKSAIIAVSRCAGIALMLAIGLAQTQTGEDGAPKFEVASIKPTDPSVPPRFRLYVGVPIETTPGRLTARNVSLEELIQGAWSLEDYRYRVTGGPAWALSARFDVEGKAAGTADRDQLLLMLRSLLADRFGLRMHRETKEIAIYALTVAKNGPKFDALDAAEATCWSTNIDPACEGLAGKMDHLPKGVRWPDLSFLTRYLMRLGADRPVLDKTGLTGGFGLVLDMNKIMAAVVTRKEAGPPTNQSIYEATVEALPDQLGLQLAPMKASVEILVIDHAEKPSPN